MQTVLAALVIAFALAGCSTVAAPTTGPADRFWPTFPVPRVVYVTTTPVTDADHRVTEQTLAGLLAHQARAGGAQEMFWVGDANAPESAKRTFDMFRRRY